MPRSARPPIQPELPVTGWTEVAMPVEQLWAAFRDVSGWPRWNKAFRWSRVRGGELREGAIMVWLFASLVPWLPYRMPVVARLVQVEPMRRVTWQVSLPGFHARHSYLFEDAGDGTSRFGSWEVAEGRLWWVFRAFWRAHFGFVCRESLAGARRLARQRHDVRLVPYGRATRLPTLVAVPGLDGSAGSIAPLVERLAEHRRVLVADYTAERNQTLDGLAEELAGQLSARIEGPFDLLGQSIGSILAARLAGHPQLRPRRVVLISTFTTARRRALEVADAVLRVTPIRLYALTAGPLMALVCGPVGDGADQPFFDAVRSSNPADARRRTRWQVGRDFTVELAALAASGVPAVLLIGARDRFIPDLGRELATLRALFGPARVRVMPGTGHVVLPSAAVNRVVAEAERFLTEAR